MKKSGCLRNCIITVVILLLSFITCMAFQHWFDIEEHVTMLFVFAVFLISLMTDGYTYGIISAVLSVLAVNFVFTFPYFAFNFKIPINIISAFVMVVIAVLTCTLTIKIKSHEAARAESEKEKMRADFLRAISHDIRSPLTTIYGSATAMIENEDNLSPEKRRRMLVSIREDSEWLIRMVENLLSVTRIDSGNVKIIKTPTVLEEFIDSVTVKFKKRYPEQKLTVSIPDDIVIVPMDPMLIEQVIMNILENSVRHAKKKTEIVLSVSLEKERDDIENAVFEITDDGCGIEPERLKNIFNGGLSRGSNPADGKKGNAGIGLSVCASIIRAHGGKISAQNKKEGGASFRFTLESEKV